MTWVLKFSYIDFFLLPFPATAPIFTVISARIFIKEPICKLDLFNIVLVIAGIILVVKPPFIFGNSDVYEAVCGLIFSYFIIWY